MSDEPRLASYPWYFDDWRGSEARAALNGEERNLYRELLDHCWEKGSLPNDQKTLQNLAGIGTREFTRSFKKVKNYFTLLEDGRYHHKKVDEKRKELIGFHKERSESGKKGGKRSAEVRSSASSSAQAPVAEAEFKPSPSPSPSPTHTREGLSVIQEVPDARAQNGTHTPPGLAVIPAALNDAMFQELTGAFMSLGVAISENDLRTCGMLWVSLDDPAKRAAHGYCLLHVGSDWKRRTEEFVPRPWNYLRERHWERQQSTNGRKAPMSKAEAAHTQAAREFMQEKGSS